MPRKAKGANPAKPNRTDLVAPKMPTPLQSLPTGMPYGQRQQLEAVARQTTPPADPLGAALATLSDPSSPTLESVGMGGPSAFPDEPITAGLPIGAGPGPEILANSPRSDVADLLMRIASSTGDQRLVALAQQAARANL